MSQFLSRKGDGAYFFKVEQFHLHICLGHSNVVNDILHMSLNDILHMSFLAGTHGFKAFPAYTTTEL